MRDFFDHRNRQSPLLEMGNQPAGHGGFTAARPAHQGKNDHKKMIVYSKLGVNESKKMRLTIFYLDFRFSLWYQNRRDHRRIFMKVKLLISSVVLIAMVMLFHPACKSEEGCEFSILGTWSVNIDVPAWDAIPAWIETLTFSGTETGGTISGWQYYPGQQGTFTVTNCTVVQMLYNYVDSYWGPTNITFNGNLTSANSMSGNGTWDDDYGLSNFNWNGTKVM
jgi:hypothetical protein